MARLVWTLPDGESTARWATDPGGGSQLLDPIVFPIAFDTPGIVIPASGPAGIPVFSLAVGDKILAGSGSPNSGALFSSVDFDGNNPTLEHIWGDANRGNLPGTPPTPEDQQSIFGGGADALTTSSALQGGGNEIPVFGVSSAGFALCVTPITFYVYIDDSAGGDPVMTQGAGEIHVLILRAT